MRMCDREIQELAYKLKKGIPLTPREKEISDEFYRRERK